jgi:hypothetical protein
LIDELKSFVETSFLIVYGHAIEISEMFGLDIDPDPFVVKMCHTVLLTLVLVYIFQGIGQARTTSGAYSYSDAKPSAPLGD